MAFYQFPSVTAMFLAVLTAFFMGKESINEKFSIFAKGAANENVLTMLMIYILTGAFASVAAAMGGRDATVNLGLSITPVDVVPYMWYCWILAIFGLLSIFFPYADGICRKDPWNWEYDVIESSVAEKKHMIEQ